MGAWLILMLLWVAAVGDGARVGDVIRRDTGDTFHLLGNACGFSECSEHGAGAGSDNTSNGCSCSCPQRAPLFREDRELCVDDLPECSLATFGTSTTGVQRIPFIYLPLKGQIIHPSKEITFQGVKTPICAVSGAQFLTRKGFVDLRNTLDADVPFSLFRDEGRTFLQWSGEDDVRLRMSGRVMVVRLLCRDVSSPPAAPLDLRGVFTPCVAFRVQGTSVRQLTNVSEVQFATNARTSETDSSSGLSTAEYIAIGISSLLLGLIYVASVFLYLHAKKRRKAASEDIDRRFSKKLKRKDGRSITEHDIVRINNERIQTLTSTMTGTDDGVVKKNPLLTMGRQFHDIKNSFPSDSGSTVSDSEYFPDNSGIHNNRYHRQVTSAIVHPTQNDNKGYNENLNELGAHRDESGIERLPDEHVSIVETTDDREIARPVGTTRRKLYFNPAYFEPHLMAEPPPAALEFLTKIREVITIAKHKMASKRFQPILNEIPEEETYPSAGNSMEIYNGLGSQRSGSVVSLKRENSRKRPLSCVGCPGCKHENNTDLQNLLNLDMPTCSNCLRNNKGDKQHSIRKWLENIPMKQSLQNNEGFGNINQNNSLVNSLLSLPYNDSKSKVKKQNSFYGKNEIRVKRKASTMSVRSEPTLPSYNLPLADFSNVSIENNFKYYGQTISRIDDIKPVGLGNYRTGSYRGNPILNQKKNKFITNKSTLPDMVNDALEQGIKSYSQSSSDEDRLYNKISSNKNDNLHENVLVNDYETDSLERMSHKKTATSDVSSSQASPSLSTALPLDEELTMRNDIYKQHSSKSNTPSPSHLQREPQNHYESITDNTTKSTENLLQNGRNDYSLVSEVYVNNNYNFGSTPTSPSGSECSMGSRKNQNGIHVPTKDKPGCLTIEVKDAPENYIKIHESDSFEPDTLDRKHTKHKEKQEKIQFSRKDLVNHLSNGNMASHNLQLRSSGTFKKPHPYTSNNGETKFCSLRVTNDQRQNIFNRPTIPQLTYSGSKSLDDTINPNEDDPNFDWDSEEGRILTLEMRHSKRQRQCTPPTIKQIKCLVRPDVLPPLPPTIDPIYEQPLYPPRRVEPHYASSNFESKNVNDRSLSPRSHSTTDLIVEHGNIENSKRTGHACSPTRASVPVQNSDYENLASIEHNMALERHSSISRTLTRQRPNKYSKMNQNINTNTYVKISKEDGSKPRFRRRRGPTIEDSGYLSSDSTSSRQTPRKINISKVVSCSESDDTGNEARSESGAESVETHSVFFGSFRKIKTSEANKVLDRTKMEIFKRSSSKKNKIGRLFYK